MSQPVCLDKFSLGVGDRFAHQARAQLQACVKASASGLTIVPVWNKSNREHNIVHSEPSSVRQAADAAVKELGWTHHYHVDADHISLSTVDRFLGSSDFFTIDVADAIGRAPAAGAIERFLTRHPELVGRIDIPGIGIPVEISHEMAGRAACQYLHAVSEAGRIYRYVENKRGKGNFITEVSMDETVSPQTPTELLLILAAIADEGIPIQTIAPKFTGRFNKGVDYAGDVFRFEQEFDDDLAVINHAVRAYGLPGNLKLSVHSGSDKFSIYAPIRRSIRKFGVGVHVKTAGTTWLEELIGLAEAGGEGLAIAKDIYQGAFEHSVELCAPYASVIDIDVAKLPSPAEVRTWSSDQYTSALRHDQSNPAFNPHLRQLLHVGYKIAVSMGERFTQLLEACEETISRNVTANLYERHIQPIFLEPQRPDAR
jgi:hypothetical protein